MLDKADEVSCFLETANSNAKIWAWNGSIAQLTENKWPGDAMPLVGKAANGKTGWYKVSIPANFISAKYVLSDGTGAQKLNGSVYTSQSVTLKGAGSLKCQ